MIALLIVAGLVIGAAFAIAWAGRPEMTRFEDEK